MTHRGVALNHINGHVRPRDSWDHSSVVTTSCDTRPGRTPFIPAEQVLAEMIIFNESRLGGSRVLATYSKPRMCSTRLSLRYQVIPVLDR